MHPDFYKDNPFRPLRWRADRVMQMVEHQPLPLKPGPDDDHYVRAYRRYLLSYRCVGDDGAGHTQPFPLLPHVYKAHWLKFHAVCQLRHEIEAWLFTSEPLTAIANRYALDPLAIEFYEQLFFNVRDRLGHFDWISKVIRNPSSVRRSPEGKSANQPEEGYWYRLFGYHGGPLVLDVICNGMKSPPTERAEDTDKWFDRDLEQSFRMRFCRLVSALESNKDNALQLIKSALRANRIDRLRLSRTTPGRTMPDQELERIVAALRRCMTIPSGPPANGSELSNEICRS